MRKTCWFATFALTALAAFAGIQSGLQAQTPDTATETKTVKMDVTTDGRDNALGAQKVEVHQGRLYVPLRRVVERLGYAVDWDARAQTVVVTQGDQALSLPIGGRTMANGNAIDSGGPAYISGTQIMVPLRFVAETLGAQVNWNPNDSTVHISRNAATVGVGTAY